jgi:hypothetical protein
MKYLALFVWLFLSQWVGTLAAQDNRKPIKLELKKKTFTETNSKYGTQTRIHEDLVLTYSDGHSEVVSMMQMWALTNTIPSATLHLKKYRANSLYKIGTIPLFTAGFLGFYNLVKGSKNQVAATLIGIGGVAGGYAALEYFNWQKKRSLNRLILNCNREWLGQNQPDKSEHKLFEPNIIKFGFLDGDANFGIGLKWSL